MAREDHEWGQGFGQGGEGDPITICLRCGIMADYGNDADAPCDAPRFGMVRRSVLGNLVFDGPLATLAAYLTNDSPPLKWDGQDVIDGWERN